MKLSRRSFVSALAASAILPTYKVRGANEDIRIAIIGTGGKGTQHITNFGLLEGVRIVAVCDPDDEHSAAAAKNVAKLKKNANPNVKIERDLREVYQMKDVDAVVVATPNHWHALAAIWACQAGKDVYVEKPVCYDLWEGRQMIAAARKYNRLVQGGTQRRSDPGFPEAFAWLREGHIGNILRARVLHYSVRGPIGMPAAAVKPPAHIDYNLWAGPASAGDVLREKFHYDWHWFWDTGNGELGNNGPHGIDLARWALGHNELAPRVLSFGGRFVWKDNGQTPNTQVAFYDYKPAPLIAEVRNLPTRTGSNSADAFKATRVGFTVECEGGYYSGLSGGAAYDNNDKLIKKFNGDNGKLHAQNFINALRSRKVSDLNCPIDVAYVSSGLCHQGNVSFRVGRQIGAEQAKQALKTDSNTADAFERMMTHLGANEVEPKTPITLGPALDFDAKSGNWTGAHADKANPLNHRKYRAPFVINEVV